MPLTLQVSSARSRDLFRRHLQQDCSGRGTFAKGTLGLEYTLIHIQLLWKLTSLIKGLEEIRSHVRPRSLAKGHSS